MSNIQPAQDADLTRAMQLARAGAAYFDDKLGELTDGEYDEPSLLPGWSRRFVIAHVGYNAQALARLITWASTGIESPMYSSMEQRNAEIEVGAALSPVALRDLHHGATKLLNIAWRDLPAGKWTSEVRTMQGRTVTAAETVWMRTREVWLHAVDLDSGGSFTDMPAEFIDRLLADVTTNWASRGVGLGIVLEPADRPAPTPVTPIPPAPTDPTPTLLRAPAAELAQWATGRTPRAFTTNAGEPLSPPRWL